MEGTFALKLAFHFEILFIVAKENSLVASKQITGKRPNH
jgi:hypothetical protein